MNMKFSVRCIAFVCLLLSMQTVAQEQKGGEKKYEMKTYYLVFLKKGSNRNQDFVTAQKFQEGHLAHLNRMADSATLR
jgi:hypothetical protein